MIYYRCQFAKIGSEPSEKKDQVLYIFHFYVLGAVHHCHAKDEEGKKVSSFSGFKEHL